MNLHQTIVSKHETVIFKSEDAKVSIRKDKGLFVVRVRDYYYGKTSRTEYKTLAGAQIAAEAMRRFYL